MITESTIRRVDHYLYADYRAQSLTLCYSLLSGIVGLLLFSSWGLSTHWRLALSTLVIFFVSILRIGTYRLPDHLGGRRRDNQSVVRQAYERRTILWSLPLATAAFCAYFILPESTQAEAISGRIKKLVARGDLDEAATVVRSAIHARISLPSEALRLVASPVRLDSAGAIQLDGSPPIDPLLSPFGSFATIDLGSNNFRVQISMPSVYMPKGQYRIDGTLYPGWVSLTGDGAGQTYLLPDHLSFEPDKPLFEFRADMQRDVILDSFSVKPHPLSEALSAVFVSAAQANRAIVALQLEILKMKQILDYIVWYGSTFEGCELTWYGRTLQLNSARFINCTFIFAPECPSDLVSVLERANGRTITVTWKR